MRRLPISIDRVQRMAACAVVLACAALFVRDAVFSSRTPFLIDGTTGHWIAAPEPVTAMAQRPRSRERTRFGRIVRLERAPAAASLELSALGDAEVRVNGVPAGGPVASDPKRVSRIDLAPHLAPGENRIEVVVRRALGPALIRAALEIDGARSGTDTDWRVIREPAEEIAHESPPPSARSDRPGGRARSGSSAANPRGAAPGEPTPNGVIGVESGAVRADDTRTLVEARSVPSSLDELRARGVALGGLFVLASGLAVVGLRAGGALGTRLPAIVTGLVLLFWTVVFASRTAWLGPLLGFDAGGHWEYVQWLIERREVPLATDGWSLYHPPLFYLLPAAIVSALGAVQETNLSGLLVKAWTFAGGLASVLGTAAIARRIHAADPRSRCFAIACSGLAPVQILISSHFSNESWLCAWLVLAMLACTQICLAETPRVRDFARLGVWLGLALLTKYTAVVVAPILLGFAGLRVLLSNRIPIARAAGLAALPLGIVLVLAGWFFARNQLVFGTPMPANWGDLASADLGWWQQPGFHTARWYLRFGESLLRPWFAGFASFWDALYGTFWGDGYIAGLLHLADRHRAWNYGWMSVTYPLALPATLVALGGTGIGVHRSLHDPCARRRLALAALATTGFVLLAALAVVSLRYPYYGQVKAFYILPALAPLAVLGAFGFSALDDQLARRGGSVARALVLGAWGTLAAAIVLSFLG